MGKIIAVVNQKGGVGKTTTCVNLVAALKEQGKRVLLCDFDPQANATSGMGVDKTLTQGVYDVLINGIAPEKRVVSTRYGDVLPSCKGLAGAGIEMIGMEGRELLLRNALHQLSDNYDYILIDCPPSLELLTLNGLCAADSVLVPVQAEYFAAENMTELISTVQNIKRHINPKLKIGGVFMTMANDTNFRKDIVASVREAYGKHLPIMQTVIPDTVRLAEISTADCSIFKHEPKGKAADAYRTLVQEVMDIGEKQRSRSVNVTR